MRERLGLFVLLTLLSSASCDGPASPSAPAAFHPGDSADGGAWTCPMCPGVSLSGPGACPRCKMALSRVRTMLAFACPLHAELTAVPAPAGLSAPVSSDGSAAERCSVCGRPLVSLTMAGSWRCRDHPDVREDLAGDCPQCERPLELRLEPLPHGDHNPRHGGILFMAPDGRHHLEGAWPAAGEFRLYFYDDFTRPLPAGILPARAVLTEGDREAGLPLTAAPNGEFLEAKLDPPARPSLELTAFVRFGAKEDRFDFIFPELSREPAAGSPGGAAASPVGPPAPLAIPSEPEAIAAEILARGRRLEELMGKGAWRLLYMPAMEAKELALALEDRVSAREESKGADLAHAVSLIVRSAWLLDQSGDRGDGEAARESFELFGEGLRKLERLFPQPK